MGGRYRPHHHMALARPKSVWAAMAITGWKRPQKRGEAVCRGVGGWARWLAHGTRLYTIRRGWVLALWGEGTTWGCRTSYRAMPDRKHIWGVRLGAIFCLTRRIALWSAVCGT
jgi:hypothetical protein